MTDAPRIRRLAALAAFIIPVLLAAPAAAADGVPDNALCRAAVAVTGYQASLEANVRVCGLAAPQLRGELFARLTAWHDANAAVLGRARAALGDAGCATPDPAALRHAAEADYRKTWRANPVWFANECKCAVLGNLRRGTLGLKRLYPKESTVLDGG
jgi:hypothetical protein